MRRIKVGDVFEIVTPKGKAYFQFVFDNKQICELIRVLPGIYSEQPSDMIKLVAMKELYFVHFPLKAAFNRQIVEFIDNFVILKELELPPKYMRVDYSDISGKRGWHIVRYNSWQRQFVQELTQEQMKLSSWETWNDTMLIKRIIDGWSLDQWV